MFLIIIYLCLFIYSLISIYNVCIGCKPQLLLFLICSCGYFFAVLFFTIHINGIILLEYFVCTLNKVVPGVCTGRDVYILCIIPDSLFWLKIVYYIIHKVIYHDNNFFTTCSWYKYPVRLAFMFGSTYLDSYFGSANLKGS